MGHRRQSHRAISFAACILLMLVCARAGSARGRVVAIGDVHGSFPQLTKMLQQTGLIDANRRWVGGSTTLVQTGDVVDRGPRTRDCLDLLMSLEKEASRKRGKVIPLLGNHEVMDMMGDLRYVSREDFAASANQQSEARREEAYREFRAFVDASPRRRKSLGEDETAARQKWMQAHPVGFLEYRDAFGPRGLYGRWLRAHDTVAQVDETIFLHAGLSPQLPFRDFREVNQRVRDEIQRFDELWDFLARKKIIWRYMTFQEASDEIRAALEARAEPGQKDEQSIADKEMREFAGIGGWAILATNGPLWYRGFAEQSEEQLQPFVDTLLTRFHARHFVVGHTVVSNQQVTPRLGDRIIMIDTGMVAEGRGGRASALEIRNDTVRVFYSGEEPQLLLPSSPKAVPDSGTAHAN